MSGYLPFARRIITSVHPPSPSARFPSLYALDTAKAPWTADEGWRRMVQEIPDEDADFDDDDADTSSVTTDSFGLEKEKATVEEPELMTIWCDLSGVQEKGHVLGCGLRGRWAMMQPEEGDAFWVFKAKDCEYPIASVREGTVGEQGIETVHSGC